MQQPMKVWSMSGQFRLCPVLHLLRTGGYKSKPVHPQIA